MTQVTGNHHGTVLENQIRALLDSKKYIQVTAEQHNITEVAWYTPQYRRNKTLYGSQMRIDFVVYHPKKWPHKVLIECKWQSSPGTVDEKYPYMVLSLKQISDCKSVVLVAGGGYRPGAVKWLLEQQDDNFTVVEGMDRIIRWANIEL